MLILEFVYVKNNNVKITLICSFTNLYMSGQKHCRCSLAWFTLTAMTFATGNCRDFLQQERAWAFCLENLVGIVALAICAIQIHIASCLKSKQKLCEKAKMTLLLTNLYIEKN